MVLLNYGARVIAPLVPAAIVIVHCLCVLRQFGDEMNCSLGRKMSMIYSIIELLHTWKKWYTMFEIMYQIHI